MNVQFKQTALDDIRSAADYLLEQFHNAAAAKKLTETLFHSALLLADHSFLGAALHEKFDVNTDLRFLVSAKFLIFYRVTEEHVEVVRVLDGRQDYLALLF